MEMNNVDTLLEEIRRTLPADEDSEVQKLGNQNQSSNKEFQTHEMMPIHLEPIIKAQAD